MTEPPLESPIPSFSSQDEQKSIKSYSKTDEIRNSQNENLTCLWNDCTKEFPDHTSLASHLSEDHVGWKKSGYYCDWNNCPRRGLKSHNRFALLMHLRIHTGEKPFECTFENCGQTFGRMDALTRHKKAEHGEDISEKIINKTAHIENTVLKKKKRTSSLDSLSKSKRLKKTPTSTTGDWSSGEESDDSISNETSTSSKRLIPGSSYSQYRLAKAQLLYILRENEMLQDEYELVHKKLQRMKTERRVLLDAVMAAEQNKNDEEDNIPDVDE